MTNKTSSYMLFVDIYEIWVKKFPIDLIAACPLIRI